MSHSASTLVNASTSAEQVMVMIPGRAPMYIPLSDFHLVSAMIDLHNKTKNSSNPGELTTTQTPHRPTAHMVCPRAPVKPSPRVQRTIRYTRDNWSNIRSYINRNQLYPMRSVPPPPAVRAEDIDIFVIEAPRDKIDEYITELMKLGAQLV